MNCEIIAVGTELLLGQIINTNGAKLSQYLANCGIDVFFHTVVGDNPSRIKDAFKIALDRSDIIISTGGLGPTDDDLTKEMVSDLLDLKMELDDNVLMNIKEFFHKIGRDMTDNNIKQALIPKGSKAIPNLNGTAPGIHIKFDKKDVFLLPGPPNEMIPMAEEYVVPIFKEKTKSTILSKELFFAGIGESTLEMEIKDLIISQKNPTIAPLALENHVKLRVTAKANNKKIAADLVEEAIKKIENRVGKYIFSKEPVSLQEVVVRLLTEKGNTLSVAESCTGGMLSSDIVSIPGSSKIFKGSIVAYDNSIKESLLGVSKETLQNKGAVSRETSIEMAKGIKEKLKTDFGISITGIAGPVGGTDEKPVGLTYISLADEFRIYTKELQFVGNREKIRSRASFAALNMIWLYLKEGFIE
jgi:nicotinamide-nucleotide amidase